MRAVVEPGDTSLRYTPDAGFVGRDSVHYRLRHVGATADRARDDAATLVAGITGTWDLRQRLRHAVDPRPFLPRRAARRRVDPIPTDDERVPLRA